MRKISKIIFIIIAVQLIFIQACDMYPDWEDYVEYSETFPISGEYYVQDYNYDTDSIESDDYYKIYIYNKAYNPTGDSIWIDNRSFHGSSSYQYKYKIKTRANLDNLSFDCERAGNVTGTNVNPLDSVISVTIMNSKVYEMSGDISDATPDSIYFEFIYYDKFGNELNRLKTAGHRKTGWEDPQNDDDM